MKDDDLFKSIFSDGGDIPESEPEVGFPTIAWGITEKRTNEIDEDVQEMVHDAMCPEHSTPESRMSVVELVNVIQTKYKGDEQKWAIYVLGCEVTKRKLANIHGSPLGGIADKLKGLLEMLGMPSDDDDDDDDDN